MNWEAAGAIGEVVGAIAVVISLLYLATQIRTQNSETRLAAVHEILVGFREVVQIFTTVDMSELFVKANYDYDSLSEAELVRLIAGILPMFRLWEEAFIQNEQGRLEDRVWVGINSQYTAYLSYSVLSRVWELRRGHFDKSFQSFVQGMQISEVTLQNQLGLEAHET
jgi:hypothetical protein